MLDVRCPEKLAEVLAFAESRGLRGQLQEKLDYLAGYSNGPGGLYPRDRGLNTRCVLYTDRAPNSFGFAMQRLNTPVSDPDQPPEDAWALWFAGGLIFFERGDIGSGAPTNSVRFGEEPVAGWSIHT